ncbi:MAG: FAD-binding and (Fe-S)-binding domain-containing protein [Thermodesulfobacteriota bacterium]
MPKNSPHITLPRIQTAERVLELSQSELQEWPEYIQDVALDLANELFLIRYNPFIPPGMVYKNVINRLKRETPAIQQDYFSKLQSGLNKFWQEFEQDQKFKHKLIKRLKELIPAHQIVTSPNALVESSTDATDLRMQVPLLLVAPQTTQDVKNIISLANEMGFSIVPRGGGSGLTGGAVPTEARSVVLSLSRMKSILSVDPVKQKLCTQSGVITLDAIEAANRKGFLLSIDPASKASSSLGGNISENAGGPLAFEYGTTLDNILDFKMITPTGRLLKIARPDHARQKIGPEEEISFDILDEQDSLVEQIKLKGKDIRSSWLGKDVSNKYLGGLPGVQKEGVDGIITEACFTIHPKLSYSQTLCLEFYGNSMHNAMLVIKDLVRLRDLIRENRESVKISALEEFGSKYVQAIEYRKKSNQYEGDPISVLLMQLDSSDQGMLAKRTRDVENIAREYHNVDVFKAEDEQEAKVFWEDRHKLSAITKRTSGFKINEDVVIPIDFIPEFSKYIEFLNLYYLALGYRNALLRVHALEGTDPGDEFIDMELNYCSQIFNEQVGTEDLSEQELELQIHYFFRDLGNRYPELNGEFKEIEQELFNTRIMIANHMHAGDGNCHVNIPVNSNNSEMWRLAEEAAKKVFNQVLELQGSISGEHGIGITKIAYLPQEKINLLKDYKSKCDPNNILNPGKLIHKIPKFPAYTFSFNGLIQDLNKSYFPGKEKIIDFLQHIQICSRCGKCKSVCPMYYPEEGYLYHPRNKIISLGALLEAIYYTYMVQGKASRKLLKQLQDLLERCTLCGKCCTVCPVSIDMPDQISNMRTFLEEAPQGGQHPLKHSILSYLNQDPGRISKAAKIASLGQDVQNKTWGRLPKQIRQKFQHPALRDLLPQLEYYNLQEILDLERGNIFYSLYKKRSGTSDVFYFPGCGSGLFYPGIALASIHLMHRLGINVIIPDRHMCCGYPYLASGFRKEYTENQKRNEQDIQKILHNSSEQELNPGYLLTSCGTCREALGEYDLKPGRENKLLHRDITQFLIQVLLSENMHEDMVALQENSPDLLLYHPACHNEWVDVPTDKAKNIYAQKLGELLQTRIVISPGCCGESGLGAMTSPHIYETIKNRKRIQLQADLEEYPQDRPVIVGCPSCKVGLNRIFRNLENNRQALHTVEYLAELYSGANWRELAIKELKESRQPCAI